MIDFKRTNTWIAWVVFALSLLVYALTAESTVSFWDCGEFISAAYKLQITHPPGAPLYQLLGRVFSLFALGNTDYVAYAVNMLSAVSSAFCVQLTFLITSRIAQKIINPLEVNLPTQHYVSIWAAAIIAALTLAFSDTFWFSAVEAEVYSLSSLFTMLCVWAALKWDEQKSSIYHIRWLLLIAFIVGLSIGVHLLNLLVIPAIACFLFLSAKGCTAKNIFIAIGIGLSILLLIQFVILPGIPYLAFITDRWANTSMNLDIGIGATVFLLLVVLAVVAVLIISKRLKYIYLHISFLCFAFLLIGFSSYMLVPIRAVANTPININKPDNAASFLSYINRDQYGKRALLYGPSFNAPITTFKKGSATWRTDKNKNYIVSNYKTDFEFDENYLLLFPRMGDIFDKTSVDGYVGWTGVNTKDPVPQLKNWEFFFKYQFLHMYVRYHLWNFAGKQNDNQGHGNAMDGNSQGGIPFIDNFIAAPTKGLPQSLESKGKNHYYYLPLLLGIIGLFFHAKKQKETFIPLLVLFLFTGIFLAFYLNVPPFEPRERDYVFVGAFQVFSIWVGLGVFWLSRFLRKYLLKGIWIGSIIGFIVVPFLLFSQNWDDHNRANRSFAKDYARNMLADLAPNAILIVHADNDTYPLWYIQNVEGYRTDVGVINANLIGSDWGAFSLVKNQYSAKPIQLSINPYSYQLGKFDAVGVENGKPALLSIAMEEVTKDTMMLSSGKIRAVLPTNKLLLGNSKDTVSINSKYLQRFDLLLLDVIANNPQRPIYLSSRSAKNSFPFLSKYFQKQGLVRRLIIDGESTFNYSTAIQNWELNGFNSKGIFIDEEARKLSKHYTSLMEQHISALLKTEETKKAALIAALCAEKFPVETTSFLSYKTPLIIADAFFKGAQTDKAKQYAGKLMARLITESKYYISLSGTIANYSANKELEETAVSLAKLRELLLANNETSMAMEIEKFLSFFAIRKK